MRIIGTGIDGEPIFDMMENNLPTEMERGDAKVTICKECRWAEFESAGPIGSVKYGLYKAVTTGNCLNPKAPVTDFVTGEKRCMFINQGACPHFEKVREEG